MSEHAFARTEILIGAAGLASLRQKKVFVAGLGGVGGFCAEALARAGVGHLAVLDFDRVAASNLNRQLLALHSTVGREKSAVMVERLRDIDPELQLSCYGTFLQPSEVATFLDALGPVDFIADCIDSIACKAALVDEAQRRGLPIISALGAGNRLDPQQIKVGTLEATRGCGCGLARELRRVLRKRGARLDYPVVYSEEPPRPCLPHQPIEGPTPGRARAVNGTISYLPGLVGLTLAGVIIPQLLGVNPAMHPCQKQEAASGNHHG